MATYKLITPITKVDGETKITEVEVKDFLTGSDLQTIGNTTGDGNTLIAIASAMVLNVSKATILNMDARDVKNIAAMAKDFLDSGEN